MRFRRSTLANFLKILTTGLVHLFSAFMLLPAAILLSSADAQTYSLFYSFTGGADGGNPQGQMIRDSSGNLFGSTVQGGDLSCGSGNGCGVIFKIDSSANLTVLHTFTGPDGSYPFGDMASDASNNLYGTTSQGGGTQASGVVFKLNKVTGEFNVLHRFGGGTEGGEPNGVIRDSVGNLYGTTFVGGAAGCGDNLTCGTIYKLDRAGSLTVLYNFTGGTDGGLPIAVIRDNAGNFYGTTLVGGDLNCQPNTVSGSGCGTVFELTAAGSLKVLHAFTGGKDGENDAAVGASQAGLIRNSAGDLFGTSIFGGLRSCKSFPGCGVVFETTAEGKYKVLYSFTGGADGYMPTYALTSDSSGNLYSTTTEGGFVGPTCGLAGCGTVFELDTSGQLQTLYSFTNTGDGFYPNNLISDPSGNLYGETTGGGGNSGTAGTIFKITP